MDLTASMVKREEGNRDRIALGLEKLRADRDGLRQQIKDVNAQIKMVVGEQTTVKQVLTVLYRRQERQTQAALELGLEPESEPEGE